MSVRFWWCHTWGCPNYGHARTLDGEPRCGYCKAEMKPASPDDHPLNTTAPGEAP